MQTKAVFVGLAALATLMLPAAAWQSEVHSQIGFMADELVNENVRLMAKMILEPQYNGSLGRAGAWADSVRKTTHRYSYGWHFISALDDPPRDCNLDYKRDCQKGGCVVQQIANQTAILEGCVQRLKNNQPLPNAISCSEALKWIVHFIGDVAQPLHNSNLLYGGNKVPVVFNGSTTNLHQAWDKVMLYALAPFPDGLSLKSLDPFFANLLLRIQINDFASPVSSWAMCDLDARRGTYCGEQWAKDSNKIVCSYVYSKLVDGDDLLTGQAAYADGALPIIEEQVAKAAWRLTGWLNALADRVLGASGQGRIGNGALTEIQEGEHEPQWEL